VISFNQMQQNNHQSWYTVCSQDSSQFIIKQQHSILLSSNVTKNQLTTLQFQASGENVRNFSQISWLFSDTFSNMYVRCTRKIVTNINNCWLVYTSKPKPSCILENSANNSQGSDGNRK
jgi:hypothetical protein